jgi:asparagine synthase (glutamine-hydrolysing)
MPGIAGLAGKSCVPDLLPRMLTRLRRQSWYTHDHWVDESGGAALGRIGLGYVNTAPQPAVNENGSKRAVLEGEIYDYPILRRELEAKGHRFQSNGHAELLLHGWEEDGITFVRRLNGCFAAAVWDSTAETLTLLNDRFGMRALYYSHSPGRLMFGSEIKALLADPDLSRATDPRGLAQFFTFGQYLGDTTSFAAVSMLPAAGVLTYYGDDDRLELTRYARLGESWHLRHDSEADALDRIDEALARSVDRCTRGTANLGLALSGGLDARTILGLIDPSQSVKTVCLGMDGSIDVRCAEELARLTHRPHHMHSLGTRFLADFGRHIRDMVHLTDGQYLCQCIVMPTLPVYRDLGIEVLVRGHAGELMHMTKAYNFSLDAEALASTDATLEGWLWQRLQAHMLDGVAGSPFTPAFGTNLTEQARESLRDSLAESHGIVPPVHRIWQLFLSERIRRETGLSMSEFGSVVETRLPYLDNDLINALMAAPPELKLGETIQTHVLRKRQPAFLNVVNANTGARLGAGRTARALSRFKLKVFAKLGVKGYQPYERLGLWLRRDLRPFVESVLLHDRCLERGVFNPETVRAVVANHNANRQNHTFLLMAMMIFELGQRELVDGDVHTEANPVAEISAR